MKGWTICGERHGIYPDPVELADASADLLSPPESRSSSARLLSSVLLVVSISAGIESSSWRRARRVRWAVVLARVAFCCRKMRLGLGAMPCDMQ